MALEVEDGTGKTNAEAYASVAFATAYFDARKVTGWTGAADVLEAAMRNGAEYLDHVYKYKGIRVSRDQALDFPRRGIVVDAYELDSDVMPVSLQRANAQAGLRSLTEDLFPDILKPGRIKREKVGAGQGAVEKDVTYTGGGRSQVKKFREIDLLMQDLTRGGGRVRHLIRS